LTISTKYYHCFDLCSFTLYKYKTYFSRLNDGCNFELDWNLFFYLSWVCFCWSFC